MRLTIMGKPVPQKARKTGPTPLQSHIAGTNHAAEIQRLLDRLPQARREWESRPPHDPWDYEDWLTDRERLHGEITQMVGDIHAHLGYLHDAGEHRAMKRLGMSIDPRVIELVDEVCPGALTGNWRYLTREVVPW